MVGAVVIGSLAVFVAAAAAIVVTARRWRALPPYARSAQAWLAAGLGVAAATAVGTAVLGVWSGGHAPGVCFLGGAVVICALVTVGLNRMPGLPEDPGGRARRLLDGLLVGGSVYLVCWQWLYSPGAGLFRLGDRLIPVAVSTAVACLAWGVGVVATWRSRSAGFASVASRVVPVGIGLGLIGASATLVTASLAGGWWSGTLAVSFAPATVGCALFGLAAVTEIPRHEQFAAEPVRQPEEPRPLAPLGGGPTLFSVGVVVLQTAVFTAATGGLDAGSASVGIPIAVMLGARVCLALRDTRRYAERLSFSEAHFRWMANTDPLTGLANRRRLRQALEVADHRRSTLLALDLDGFKDINDMCGHDVGDAVLVEVGQRLRAGVGAGDLVVRLGGDEFAVLMTADLDQAYAIADRLLMALCRPYEVDGGLQHVSSSIGVAGCGTADDADAMMRNADLALRFAKKRGKSRVELFELAYDRWLQRRLAIERELRGAMARDELAVLYQPVVDMATGRLAGAEALIRWNHPTLGHLSPVEFIPVVDEIGLAGPLGEWVRDRACRQLGHWLADGHDVWVAVNVSVRELRAPEYVPRVLDTLRNHGIPPDRLVVELTEHDVAQDIDELSIVLIALRELGVRIALDDFGAGHSSLGRLRRLAVDIIKIDRTLVAEPSRHAGTPTAPLVDVIVRLGERLGLAVIAEGVEDTDQRAVVESAGCPYGQGYLFGRPMPPERLAMMLTPAPRPGHGGGPAPGGGAGNAGSAAVGPPTLGRMKVNGGGRHQVGSGQVPPVEVVPYSGTRR